MKWFEFKRDNGDGSFSSIRFKTSEEANTALEWLDENKKYFLSDGDGVTEVDTENKWFFSSLEQIKKEA